MPINVDVKRKLPENRSLVAILTLKETKTY